tara:strand:+ start:125 stop:472 length:348 start_codon:yes stop_codon:yes gene_type:complete
MTEIKKRGRKKGSTNKITKDMREILMVSFQKAGGVDYLVKQSVESPVAYLGLLGKIVPSQVAVSVSHSLDLGQAMKEATIRRESLTSLAHDIDGVVIDQPKSTETPNPLITIDKE